ncbi:MAG: site-specific DNA-methyltransferase [Ktedonobacteraceae bacterium]|nr:site-specific DNA-methyltransferase [Ktedonobacteraceae bacterium]
MRTCIRLRNEQLEALPEPFAHDDVRYPPELVRVFLREYTHPGDLVFDPFAGFGTTLYVAEEMDRRASGIEYDPGRCAYIRSHLRHPQVLLQGDARLLSTYSLPCIDFTLTSPPYMHRDDPEDPLAAYQEPGRGYDAYLADLQEIYRQIGLLMKETAVAVIEVSNLKKAGSVTPLAWDIAHAISQVLHFQGEVVVHWEPTYGYGYDHSYCLLFTRP